MLIHGAGFHSCLVLGHSSHNDASRTGNALHNGVSRTSSEPIFRSSPPGGVWSAEEAGKAVEQGGDFIGVGRAGIGHPDWPAAPRRGRPRAIAPSVSVEHLATAGLEPHIHQLHAPLGWFCRTVSAPAAIRTRVPGSGGRGDIHYTTGAARPRTSPV